MNSQEVKKVKKIKYSLLVALSILTTVSFIGFVASMFLIFMIPIFVIPMMTVSAFLGSLMTVLILDPKGGRRENKEGMSTLRKAFLGRRA